MRLTKVTFVNVAYYSLVGVFGFIIVCVCVYLVIVLIGLFFI